MKKVKESFKYIPGTNKIYMVSNKGRFMVWDRLGSDGRKLQSQILKPSKAGKNNAYLKIAIRVDGNVSHRTCHSLVAEVFLGHDIKSGLVVHHKNNDGHDNRVSNLEIITQRDNLFTHNGKRKSKYQGVNFNVLAGKWRSAIYLDKKQVHLGTFDTEYDAHLAYQEALKQVI